MWTYYSELEGIDSDEIQGYFRMSDVGQYQGWSQARHSWVSVPKATADSYSRSIENGDVLVSKMSTSAGEAIT